MNLSFLNEAHLVHEMHKICHEMTNNIYRTCIGKHVEIPHDGKNVSVYLTDIDTSERGEVLFYGRVRKNYTEWEMWSSCFLATTVTKIYEGYKMIYSEYEFGKLVAELGFTNTISDSEEREDFSNVVEKMKDMLINHWHNEDSELCFNDPEFVQIWTEFKSGNVLEENEVEWCIDGIEAMMNDLVEGDEEDAFGTSWRDHFGW